MPESTPIDVVRARYPLTPDEDTAGLQAQAEQLATLRGRLNTERIREVEPAMTFDPRSGRA